MLEVSSRRIASALFLCLVVCEDHVAQLEREAEREMKEMEIERERVAVVEQVSGSEGESKSIVHTSGGSDSGSAGGGGNSVSTDSTYSGGILFHCAQGKDRTGILSMLLTFSLYGDSQIVEERAVREYAVSEGLLSVGREKERKRKWEIEREKEREMRGMDGDSNSDSDIDVYNHSNSENNEKYDDSTNNNNSNNDDNNQNSNPNSKKNSEKNSEKNTNLGEIQSLKGSPPEALRGTLDRVRNRYGGSVLGYLDHIGFTKEYRRRLQITAEKTAKLTKQ